MSDLFERFDHALDGMAALSGYPYPERRQAWLDRLAINLPELQTLQQLPPGPDLGYLAPPPCAVEPGGVPVPENARGIAAIARVARAAPEQVAKPATRALAQARRLEHLNAFVQLATENDLRQAATQAASRAAQGEPMPLLGVPVAVKDLMQVAGLPQTNGSGAPADTPRRDALAVARLRDAGALIVGTTNLHELAYGINSENPHFGWVGNPRAPGHTAGGSSGGSAAAVAAGIVRLAIGTDTAGSIRMPAACCGVVGFKPTYDAISREGVQTLGASLDHVGPIAASVADAALGYAIMAGQPARTADPRPLQGMRVGVPTRHFFEPLADDVAQAVRGALERMRADGAELVEVDLPGIEYCAALQFVTLCSEAADIHWPVLTGQPNSLGEDVRVRLELGQFIPATWYVRAQRGRAALAAMFEGVMSRVDLLATPTMRVAPPPAGSRSVQVGDREFPLHTAATSLTMPFNLAGMPALTLPCAPTPDGLPVGIQLAGWRGQDWRVLNAGARLESLLGAGG